MTGTGQRIQENSIGIVLKKRPRLPPAIRGRPSNPTFADIQRYGQGIVEGLASLVAEQIPHYC